MDFNAHFGLRKTPFTREVAVSEMYAHPQRDEVLACLVRAVQQRMSAGLEAPAGFGKTAMIRALQDALSDVRFHVHYVKVTGLSKRDMCREIAKSLGLAEPGTYPRLLRLVQEAVETRSLTDGVRTVIILDSCGVPGNVKCRGGGPEEGGLPRDQLHITRSTASPAR